MAPGLKLRDNRATVNAHEAEVSLPQPTDLLLTFRLQRFGPRDPTMRLEPRQMVRAFEGPTGPVTVAVTGLSDDEPGGPVADGDRRTSCRRFRVEAWGADAAWALEHAAVWLGAHDDDRDFAPEHRTLRRLRRDLRGLRLGQSPSLFDMLVRLILQQRVAWRDAARSFVRLSLKYGRAAPGPHGLVAALGPAAWRRIPAAEYAAAGVEGKRARCIRDAAVSARRVEALRGMSRADANQRLRAFRGVGVWTAQGLLGFGLGDPDAVQEQDYDLPRLVSVALTGEPRADDRRMLELLAPYAGHRFRVVRMLVESSIRTPRFGPRRARPAWERYRPRD